MRRETENEREDSRERERIEGERMERGEKMRRGIKNGGRENMEGGDLIENRSSIKKMQPQRQNQQAQCGTTGWIVILPQHPPQIVTSEGQVTPGNW